MAFSEGEGENLIADSRINDKQSHVEALRNYHKIMSNEEGVEDAKGNNSGEQSKVNSGASTVANASNGSSGSNSNGSNGESGGDKGSNG